MENGSTNEYIQYYILLIIFAYLLVQFLLSKINVMSFISLSLESEEGGNNGDTSRTQSKSGSVHCSFTAASRNPCNKALRRSNDLLHYIHVSQ